MPIYEYQCDECGLRTEQLFKSLATSKNSIPCELCGKDMRKLMSAANHAFAHKPTGPVPQSTGTSDDWNFDKIIGRDAEEKWKGIESRTKIKDTRIRDERKAGLEVTRDHLVPKRDGSGDYRVITEKERVVVNQNREAVFKIAKAAKQQPEKKSGD